jgi:hypothetical protein
LAIRTAQPIIQPGIIETAKQIRQSIFPQHRRDLAEAHRMSFKSRYDIQFHDQTYTLE